MKFWDPTLINFEYTYLQLPDSLYENIPERYFSRPRVVKLNADLIQNLGLDFSGLNETDIAQLLTSGFSKPVETHPLALGYAGFQFGHFVPQLGDGRALLVGEIVRHARSTDVDQLRNNSKTATTERFDLHLKGSGQTRYSRRGDGRATLNSVLREYIISEAMHGLNIPTTRSLSVCLTGETVQREENFPGAVLGRIAQSHIRIGTFQYAVSLSLDTLRALADYAIRRHDPELDIQSKNISTAADLNKYQRFFKNVVRRQKNLLVQWMATGFIHGVMNTDNVAISGETIDFGPCAFMDEFDPSTVYSFIDRQGRYAYSNQPAMAQWNLLQLGNTLSPLFSDSPTKHKATNENFIQDALKQFSEDFNNDFKKFVLKKMGLNTDAPTASDEALLQEFHELMHTFKADYTLSFRSLSELLKNKPPLEKSLFSFDAPEILSWKGRWLKEVSVTAELHQLIANLESLNPLYIPRNHLVEKAIHDAVNDQNFKTFEDLVAVLKSPYQIHVNHKDWLLPPTDSEKIQNTYCGT